MTSHADMHAQPVEELPEPYRRALDRVFVAQEHGVKWQGQPPIRIARVGEVSFIREDTGALLPPAAYRAGGFGLGAVFAVTIGILAASPEGGVGTAFMLLGALLLALAVVDLVRLPQAREAMKHGPTRRGIYVLEDALLVISDPKPVINRPERCGAMLIPRGAVTSVDTKKVHAEGGPRFVVSLRIRKTTGELVEHVLNGYTSMTSRNPLGALLEAWAPSVDSPD